MIRRRSRRYNVGVILAALAAALVIAIVGALREDEGPGNSPSATATAIPAATVSGVATASPSPTRAAEPSPAASPSSQASQPPPAPSAVPTPPPAFTYPNPASLQQASVVNVVDGDTIDVVAGGALERVRLYGVDTPERGEPCFFEAAARTAVLTRDGVLLEAGPRPRDRYGRLLAYVYTLDGVSVDAQLIAEGLGTAWREDGQHRDAFVHLETAARQAGGCLWGN